MAESAPEALRWLGGRVSPDLGGALSGIVGDRAHTRGYHRGRNFVPSTDYSRQLTEDKKGDGDYACAIDMSFSASKMKLYTGRLKAATERNDPRMKYVREFYGTLNGSDVYGLIHEGSADNTWRRSTSDSSHLWHVHISILRQYSNNKAVMQGILDILMGKGITLTLGSRMLEAGMSGEDVSALQKLLISWGANITADGDYGPATTTAVKSFQTANKLDPDGVAGPATITALKSVTQEEDDDMTPEQAAQLAYVDGRVLAMATGTDKVRTDLRGGGSAVWIVQAVKAIADAVASVDEEVAAKLHADFDRINADVAATQAAVDQVDEAVVEQIRAQPTPEATAALLKAVLGDKAEAVFRAGLGETV